ncbi:MAG: hypothetical protein GX957_02730, partial [Clostridiaceae bacterium]|nr:hypothetical protein [Clostridiaceae bacterium]
MNKLRRTILKAGSLLTAGIGTMPYMVQARQFLNDDPELCSKHISLHSGVKLFSSADNQAVQIITQIGRSLSIPSTEIIHGATTVDFVLSLPRLLSDVAPQYVIGCVDNALLALCIDAARNADVRWVWSS